MYSFLFLDYYLCIFSYYYHRLSYYEILYYGPDEEGIDSGGLAKEAFLLLSKDAAIFAGKKHKKWMVQSGTVPSSSGLNNSSSSSSSSFENNFGGLFFTEEILEKNCGTLSRPLTPGPGSAGPRRSSISIFATVTARSRRSSWRNTSETTGSSLITQHPSIADVMEAAANAQRALGDTALFIDEYSVHKGNTLKLSVQLLENEERISRENFFKVSLFF